MKLQSKNTPGLSFTRTPLTLIRTPTGTSAGRSGRDHFSPSFGRQQSGVIFFNQGAEEGIIRHGRAFPAFYLQIAGTVGIGDSLAPHMEEARPADGHFFGYFARGNHLFLFRAQFLRSMIGVEQAAESRPRKVKGPRVTHACPTGFGRGQHISDRR